jgi:hypothetical protein
VSGAVVDLRFDCPPPGDDDTFASSICIGYVPDDPSSGWPPVDDQHLVLDIRVAHCPEACP